MKFGVLVESEEGLDWDRWRATYRVAERLGFESVWLSDHLQSPWSADRHGLEPWTALAVAAAETERLVLGPLVSPVTFRAPAIVARMAESIERLAPGRFVLGLGLGWNQDEHAAAGIPFPSVKERTRLLAAAVERIRRELRIPILIGGGGRRATLPLVARYADEWNLTTASPQVYRTASGELDALCTQAERNPREIKRSVAMGMLVGRDARDLQQRGEAMRACVPPLALAPTPTPTPTPTPAPAPAPAPAEQTYVLEAARDIGWLVGTPEQLLKVVHEFEAANVERVILGHYNLADTQLLELVAETVMR